MSFLKLTILNKTALVMFVATCCVTEGYAVTYTITDLGSLGGLMWTEGKAVNNNSQVAGLSQTGGDPSTSPPVHAFLYDNGVMQDLGTLLSPLPVGGVQSFGSGLNDDGHVVGTSYMGPLGPDWVWHAFYYDGSTMQDLGTFGGPNSEAYSINNSGQIVGASMNESNRFHAFVYDGNGIQDIGTLEGGYDSFANDINESGLVTGSSSMSGGVTRAFIYDGVSMIDIGSLGGTWSSGASISNNGLVAGTSKTAGDSGQHAFIYDGSVMQDIGTLGDGQARAKGINNDGIVVGEVYTPNAATPFQAFIYDGNTMRDLCEVTNCTANGWIGFVGANDINDNGEIVGTGNTSEGQHAFLITMVPDLLDGDVAPLGSPDGVVNAADYLIMQRFALGEIIPTSLDLSHGDLYPVGGPDGVINTQDLLLHRQLLQ